MNERELNYEINRYNELKEQGVITSKVNIEQLKGFKNIQNLHEFINFLSGLEINPDNLKKLTIGQTYTRFECLTSFSLFSRVKCRRTYCYQTSTSNPDSIYRREDGKAAYFFMTLIKPKIDKKHSISRNYDNKLSEDKRRGFYCRKPNSGTLNEEIYLESKNSIHLFNEEKVKGSIRMFAYEGKYRIDSLNESGFNITQVSYSESIASEIAELISYDLYSKTDEELKEYKKYLVNSRGGDQNRLRQNLIKMKEDADFIPFKFEKILVASHIIPWVESESSEKTNVNNALLLDAISDALFDKGYISFTDEGSLIISNELENSGDPLLLQFLEQGENIEMNEEKKHNLDWHRKNIFRN